MRTCRWLAAVLLLAAPAARAGEEAAPEPGAEAQVAALLEAASVDVPACVQALRDLGPREAAPVLQARRDDLTGEARRRVDRALARLAVDWHREHVPAGMVYVPAGPVEVPREEAPWGPAGRREAVGPFYIDRTEVTVGAWRAWLASLEEAEPGCLPRLGLHVPAEDVRDDLPVARVRHAEAARYAKEVRGGRLPTAAEFERALRGSSLATWPWGERLGEERANLRGYGPGAAMPVGSLPDGASPFGVLDLVGNVAEWSATHVRQGRRGRYPLVLGGSFRDPADARLTWRWRPGRRARLGPEERLPTVGFRVVRDVPELPDGPLGAKAVSAR